MYCFQTTVKLKNLSRTIISQGVEHLNIRPWRDFRYSLLLCYFSLETNRLREFSAFPKVEKKINSQMGMKFKFPSFSHHAPEYSFGACPNSSFRAHPLESLQASLFLSLSLGRLHDIKLSSFPAVSLCLSPSSLKLQWGKSWTANSLPYTFRSLRTAGAEMC